MKYIKLFEKVRYNPAKLAAKINPNPMGFTTPQEDFRFNYCSVYFPDGAELSFDIECENWNNTINTIELTIKNGFKHVDRNIEIDNLRKTNLCQKYLQLYGSKLQFDDYGEYRFMRFNLNKEDIFDTWIDGYIYNDEKNGFAECQICLDSNNLQERNNYIIDLGIFKNDINSALQVLEEAYHITKYYNSWRKNFETILDDVYPAFSKFFEDMLNKSKSSDVYKSLPLSALNAYQNKDGTFYINFTSSTTRSQKDYINFSGLLYLYLINNNRVNEKIISDILKNYNSNIKIEKLIEALDEIH